MNTRKGFDKWTPTDARGFALQGEDDFTPLRAPVVSEPCSECGARIVEDARSVNLWRNEDGTLHTCDETPQPATLTRDEVRPGMRQIDGEWFYSSRWL